MEKNICWHLSCPVTLSTEQWKNIKNTVLICDCSSSTLVCGSLPRHMHPISVTEVLAMNVCVCVYIGALMQVYNSGTSVVKPQWSTGICEVSYSGFLIRCKTLTDPLRQQKNQNHLRDVTHCLLIFICSSHWLRECEQRNREPCDWNESVREKVPDRKDLVK